MKFALILGFLTCFSIALAEHETLVLVDNLNLRETHSQFFKSLQGKKSIIPNVDYSKCRLYSIILFMFTTESYCKTTAV